MFGNRALQTSQTQGDTAPLVIDPGSSPTGRQSLVAAVKSATGQGTGPWTNVRVFHGEQQTPGDWEVLRGTLAEGTGPSGEDVFTPVEVEESTNGGARVPWGGGTRNIGLAPTAKQLYALLGATAAATGYLKRAGLDSWPVQAVPIPTADGGSGVTDPALAPWLPLATGGIVAGFVELLAGLALEGGFEQRSGDYDRANDTRIRWRNAADAAWISLLYLDAADRMFLGAPGVSGLDVEIGGPNDALYRYFGEPPGGAVAVHTGNLGFHLPFAEIWNSSEHTPVTSGDVVLSHTLIDRPKFVWAVFRCNAADLGYTPNDWTIVPPHTFHYENGNGWSASYAVEIFNSSQLRVHWGNRMALTGTGNSKGNINPAAWRVTFWAAR